MWSLVDDEAQEPVALELQLFERRDVLEEGHGAHVLQGYRAGDHTFIAYSLGNFTFPGYPAVSNDTAILDVTLSAAGVESFSFIPVVINRQGLMYCRQ